MSLYSIDVDDEGVEFFEIVGSEEPLFEETDYHAIRAALSPAYQRLPDDEIEALVEGVLASLAPEEAEGFWNTVKNLGKRVVSGAASVLPVAAPIVGTALGGPVGGAVGSMVGQIPGRITGGAQGLPTQPAPGMAPGATPAPLPPGASSATAQLMALIDHPAFRKSLLGQLFGPVGRSTVPVGKRSAPAPFSAFLNALARLSEQAAGEANTGESAWGTPEYLLSEEGAFLVEDPALPEQRAVALLEQLYEDYYAGGGDDDERLDAGEDMLTEWFVEAGLIERAPDQLRGHILGRRW